MRRAIPVVSALVLLAAAVASRTPREAADVNPRSGGIVGLEEEATADSESRDPIRTPSGRLITPGVRDALGYVLPLDIRRGRAEREPGRPPERAARNGDDVKNRGTPFPETRLGLDDGHTQNETSIAAFGDTIIAGWNSFDATTLLMGVGRSTDRGLSWTSAILGGHAAMSDPTVKAGGAGAWFYGYIARGGPGGSDFDVFVQRSTDAGATWQSAVNVTNDANFDDKPYLDAAGGTVLVGYADFGFSPAKVRAARSTNGGVSFGSDIILANNSGGGNGACPVIDASGVYHVFWRDSFQESLWVAHSTNQGISWTADRGIVAMTPLPATLPGGFRIINIPSADADPVTGTLVVVWNDQLFGNPDILCIRSTDGGTAWSAPIRVNDDAGSAAQWFPWVTIDESGIVHAVWYDRRENGSDIDVYYARSTDAGASFDANVRVTADAFAPVLPWESGAAAFIGDYNGIAAAGGAAYPFYQDSREGNQDVYVATIEDGIVGVGSPATAPPSIESAVIAAAPNPFREQVALRAPSVGVMTRAEQARVLEIVSAGGRLVRRLALDDRASATWDGRDTAGREVPSGIYFARIPGVSSRPARLVKIE